MVNGCPKCSYLMRGWGFSRWNQAGLESNHFDSFKVYVIECFNENERFIKIR